jgi:hypothetical protein
MAFNRLMVPWVSASRRLHRARFFTDDAGYNNSNKTQAQESMGRAASRRLLKNKQYGNATHDRQHSSVETLMQAVQALLTALSSASLRCLLDAGGRTEAHQAVS